MDVLQRARACNSVRTPRCATNDALHWRADGSLHHTQWPGLGPSLVHRLDSGSWRGCCAYPIRYSHDSHRQLCIHVHVHVHLLCMAACTRAGGGGGGGLHGSMRVVANPCVGVFSQVRHAMYVTLRCVHRRVVEHVTAQLGDAALLCVDCRPVQRCLPFHQWLAAAWG